MFFPAALVRAEERKEGWSRDVANLFMFFFPRVMSAFYVVIFQNSKNRNDDRDVIAFLKTFHVKSKRYPIYFFHKKRTQRHDARK
jgi:hypothetical protein